MQHGLLTHGGKVGQGPGRDRDLITHTLHIEHHLIESPMGNHAADAADHATVLVVGACWA